MADNIRLGKEEEEALRCEGNDNDNGRYLQGEGGGGGDVGGEGEGRMGRDLFSGPCNSKLVSSFIVTILTLHLFHYLYLAVLLLLVTKGNKSSKILSTSVGNVHTRM